MHLHCNTMQLSCTVLSVTELVDSSVDWSVVESWLAAKGVAYGQVTVIEQAAADAVAGAASDPGESLGGFAVRVGSSDLMGVGWWV